jgi:hypothetical protein
MRAPPQSDDSNRSHDCRHPVSRPKGASADRIHRGVLHSHQHMAANRPPTATSSANAAMMLISLLARGAATLGPV